MTRIAEAYRSEGLLPYNQLPDITQPGWCPDPLVIEREVDDGQRLLALGLAHRTDIGNEHYRALTESTTRFTGASVARRCIIMNEGGYWPSSDTLEHAYREGGESQWLQQHARQAGMAVVSPELPRDGCDLLLAEGFTPPEIACYLFVRQAPQYGRLNRTIHRSFDYYMSKEMDQRAKETGLHFNFLVSNLIAVYEDTFHKKFDKNDTQFFYQQSVGYMLEPTSRIQEAAIACNMGRDVNFVRTIQSYVDEGVSVAWGCGWTHVRALEGRLRNMAPRSVS
ncbi:MAG TPA: hypothetical protein VD735_04010 [Candidatus Saccharimonadales bacterium]|nr:hypothetical protein [Candidatus Saccharimonadales bacterium]